MIILKSKYDELCIRHGEVANENKSLKAEVERLKIDPSNANKLVEMEASINLSLESVEKLTKENDALKAKVSELEKERVSVELRAQEITATQGVAPVPVSEEDLKPKVSLLSQMAQIRNAEEQRKFYETNRDAIKEELRLVRK
jgi:hypothetical protein